MYDIAIFRPGRSPERSTASDGDELRDAVFAMIRSEGSEISDADHTGITALIAQARAAAHAEGFIGLEFGTATLTIRPRDDAEPNPKEHPNASRTGAGATGHRELRTDQLTRGMTVRLKTPIDGGPAHYNTWFTIVELVPGPARTAAPLNTPLTPGDTILPLPADTLWRVKDTGAPVELPPSTLGIHGPLADAQAADQPQHAAAAASDTAATG